MDIFTGWEWTKQLQCLRCWMFLWSSGDGLLRWFRCRCKLLAFLALLKHLFQRCHSYSTTISVPWGSHIVCWLGMPEISMVGNMMPMRWYSDVTGVRLLASLRYRVTNMFTKFLLVLDHHGLGGLVCVLRQFFVLVLHDKEGSVRVNNIIAKERTENLRDRPSSNLSLVLELNMILMGSRCSISIQEACRQETLARFLSRWWIFGG